MMASYPSPPADPPQTRQSDDSVRHVITPNPMISSASNTAKNCKLYELIATSDEDSELKRLCDEDSDLASCGSSASRVSDPVHEPSVAMPNEISPNVLQNSVLKNRCGRKRHDENGVETRNESHFHPYANSASTRPVIHRPVVKSCTDLRSTAPVLYDLLCDDCDSENHDRSSNISRNALPEPVYNTTLDNSSNLLRPLTVQMPFVPSPGLPALPGINQFPASYITLLQQNLLHNYSSVNLVKTAQSSSYLEDLPSVTPILPSVLRDVLAFDDDTKKPMPLI